MSHLSVIEVVKWFHKAHVPKAKARSSAKLVSGFVWTSSWRHAWSSMLHDQRMYCIWSYTESYMLRLACHFFAKFKRKLRIKRWQEKGRRRILNLGFKDEPIMCGHVTTCMSLYLYQPVRKQQSLAWGVSGISVGNVTRMRMRAWHGEIGFSPENNLSARGGYEWF